MAISIFSAGSPVSGNGLTTEDQLNDLVLAERTFSLALADNADLFDSPIVYMTDGSGSGSLVQRHRLLTLGWGLSMDATAAEDTAVSASSVTAAKADVTISRRALRLDQTGLARAVGGPWGIDPIELGLTMVGSFQRGRRKALCTAVAAASTNITSAGTGSLDDLYDVIDSFTSSTGALQGGLFAVLHPFAMASIRDSLRSEVGPVAQRADVQAFIAAGAEMLCGIVCFPSIDVSNAASKHENAVMLPGAIAYSVAMPGPSLGGNAVVAQPTDMPVSIEVERVAASDSWIIMGNAYDGVAIRENARIRGLLTSTS